MIVLEERKQGTIKILSQIGKDTAITEQQIKVVKAQLDRISRLKKVCFCCYHSSQDSFHS